jgi:hypothetical protein
MADHTKVLVYLRADDVRMLRANGTPDPSAWVRELVKWALSKKREEQRERV